MHVLFRKMKKANKISLAIYFLSTILFIGSYILFAKAILSLVGIETLIRTLLLVLFFLWFLTYLLFGLSFLLTQKYKKFLLFTFIQIVFVLIMVFSSIVINKIYGKLEQISSKEYTEYKTNLIALNETNLEENSKLGMISNKDDVEGHILAHSLKTKENLKQEIVYYDDYYTMLSALYHKEIDAVFVTSNYSIVFGNEEIYENIKTETKVLYEYSEQMKTQTSTNTTKKLTEPFTILLMGVDSESDGLNANAAFNGDTLMLVTFNPDTLTATMFSIPRDTYVPIACNNNRKHKINSSAAYGTDCVIKTVEKLVNIPIDYYAKINFRGVIDLVNTLGGIDVFVEQPDYSVYVKRYGEGKLCESNIWRDMNNLVCMNTGMQHLSGEQTLAYARNRHGFLEGDIARNRHQQLIVEAMAKKLLHLKSFSEFEKLLDVIGKNIATNLSTTQILSFYQILKNMLVEGLQGNDFITIQKTYLEVYNLPVMMGNLELAALGYYEKSLQAIHDALEVNLGIKKEEMIKTFNYDFNEEYTTPIIGKGLTEGAHEKKVPSFIGKTVSDAETWATENNITLNKQFRCTQNTPGIIGDQNVRIGTSLSSISSLTVYINQICSPTNDNDPVDKDDKDNSDADNKDDSKNEDGTLDPNIPGGPNNNQDENQNKNESIDENEKED